MFSIVYVCESEGAAGEATWLNFPATALGTGVQDRQSSAEFLQPLQGLEEEGENCDKENSPEKSGTIGLG